jgi:hypothetical protein
MIHLSSIQIEITLDAGLIASDRVARFQEAHYSLVLRNSPIDELLQRLQEHPLVKAQKNALLVYV